MVKDLASVANEDELESGIQVHPSILANLNAMEEFLQQYQPCFVGNFAAPNTFSHLDMHQKRSFTRKQAQVKQSVISGRPIAALDIMIELKMGSMDTNANLSLEDALDLAVCMSFNPVNLESKEPFNPFKLHFDQKV